MRIVPQGKMLNFLLKKIEFQKKKNMFLRRDNSKNYLNLHLMIQILKMKKMLMINILILRIKNQNQMILNKLQKQIQKKTFFEFCFKLFF
jgi:hypothetical protein